MEKLELKQQDRQLPELESLHISLKETIEVNKQLTSEIGHLLCRIKHFEGLPKQESLEPKIDAISYLWAEVDNLRAINDDLNFYSNLLKTLI